MFKDETDMFDFRLEAFAGQSAIHVVTESRFTHRGVPKPLSFPVDLDLGYPIHYLVDDFEPDPDPWVPEHHQRNAAWKVIDAEADDGDVVLIMDVDEIPSKSLLDFLPLAKFDSRNVRKSSVNSCSVIALMFSNAFSAVSNGWNAVIFTTRWKRDKSTIPACTSSKIVAISSVSKMENNANPDADSNNV
jgi:hypothetical protein